MLLSILVGVLNKDKKFSFAFRFITSEATSTFEFIEAKLNELLFHNSLCPKFIYGDFAESLKKTIFTWGTQKHRERDNKTYIL